MAESLSIPIQIMGCSDTNYSNAPFNIAIPFSKGRLHSDAMLALSLESDVGHTQSLPCECTATAYWSDGSIRWLLINAHFSGILPQSKQNATLEVYTDTRTSKQNTERLITIQPARQTYQQKNESFSTRESSYSPNTYAQNRDLQLTLENCIDESNILSKFGLVALTLSSEGEDLGTSVENIKNHYDQKKRSGYVEIEGKFEGRHTKCSLRYQLTLTALPDQETVRIDASIHNPQRAKHQQGLWDLGDEGSILFNELKLLLTPSAENTSIDWANIHNRSTPSYSGERKQQLEIYQESSGGENWKSSNHINAKGEIPHKLRGYRISDAGELIKTGERISPLLGLTNGICGNSIKAHYQNFWQNFPSSIGFIDGKLEFGLFPGRYPDQFELQGGEKKTHTLFLSSSSDNNALCWLASPLTAVVDKDYLYQTDAIPGFCAPQNAPAFFRSFLNAAVEGEKSFFAKREVIDEYGWRNFGDLYADHEAAGHTASQPLISHYNNQYDPVFGFATQYLHSGEQHWFTLFDNLARHIVDIDIYHTNQDKEEYNNGLFWHTDHYLDASTCTHRSVSINHNPESYWDYQKGGGPGEEHCYSTGLLYHYYLTGNKSSADSVLQLASWIETFNAPAKCLLERLRLFVSRDLKIIRRLLKKENVPYSLRPLTRGTGNHIQTLLDAYLLTNDIKFISRVETIIKETMHPKDDLELKPLRDIENGWSYTVLLQALIRYLDIKLAEETIDDDFEYARATLIHYAKWMAEHEKPYLSRADELEHPNDTWVAQEIRKAHVLFAAYYYSGKQSAELKSRAEYFGNYCAEKLTGSDNPYLTRLFVLVLQNGYSAYQYALRELPEALIKESDTAIYAEPEYYSYWKIVAGFIGDSLKLLSKLSPSKELHWLTSRSSRAAAIAARVGLRQGHEV